MSCIAVLGDVHDRRDRLERVLGWLAAERPDLALLVGDVGLDPPWERADRLRLRAAHDASVRDVVARVGDALRCPVVFVPGNHDLPDPPPSVPGTNADGRVVERAGLRIAGLGGAGPARFGFPYEWSDEEADGALDRLLRAGPSADILLSHAPPARTTLDRTARGEHVGSEAVRRWLGRARPRMLICGHIHEAPGVEPVEGVPCLNAGALGEPYGRELGWIVGWTAGPVRIEAFEPGPGTAPCRTSHPAPAS